MLFFVGTLHEIDLTRNWNGIKIKRFHQMQIIRFEIKKLKQNNFTRVRNRTLKDYFTKLLDLYEYI